jgi:nucleotide-binding universal stress UspA family protein
MSVSAFLFIGRISTGSWTAICPEESRLMRLLVCVDGSRWAYAALQSACRWLQAEDEVVLLTVCPRAGEGYLECGRMALEAAQRACAGMLSDIQVRTRLEVGDPRTVVSKVAAEERADVVVMGALGSNGLPYGPSLGETARAAWNGCTRPILVGSPRGVELLAGEECLLVGTRQDMVPQGGPVGRPVAEPVRVNRGSPSADRRAATTDHRPRAIEQRARRQPVGGGRSPAVDVGMATPMSAAG